MLSPVRRTTLVLALLAFGCDDDPAPTAPTTTTTAPVTPPPSGGATLRVAQLTEDARTVDVLLNGAAVFQGVGYPGASGYAELAAGTYRVQFFPEGSRAAALVETNVTLSEGEIATAAIVGYPPFTVQTFRDGAGASAGRARIRLVNAVPDFPAAFDLGVRNGPGLVQGIARFGASGYAEVIPGLYDLELLRSGSSEVVVAISGRELGQGASYTVFAVGTLRRNDIELFVALDGG